MDILAIDRFTQKKRKYWTLRQILAEGQQFPVRKRFVIKEHSWTYRSGFFDFAHLRKFGIVRSSEWLEIEVIDHVRLIDFYVRVGIVRKSGKEIVVSNVEVISPEKFALVIQLIHHSKLHEIMKSYRELNFFVVIDEKGEEREAKNNIYMQKLRTDYKELLLSGRNSDFTIHVSGRKFEVHRSILGARSPVFSAMMEHDMKEKRSGEVTIIDADPAVFRGFLFYLYTGGEEHLDWKNIVELYTLGDKYCVEDLKYLCVERMKTHISIDNFFQVFYISLQLNNTELSEDVIRFFIEDSKEIVASENVVSLPKNIVKRLMY